MTPTTTVHDSDTFRIGGDLEVHRLGYGAMQITGDGVWGPPDDRDGRPGGRSAPPSSSGVDFIDTADSYGPLVSEQIIAEALHPYPDGPGHRHQGRPHPHRPGESGRRSAARRTSSSRSSSRCATSGSTGST